MPSPEALAAAETPADGRRGACGAARRDAAEPPPERRKPAGGYFSLAFHSRLANMGEEKILSRFTSTKEARRRNGLETGDQGSHDVRKR